jgi:hypothetical protein
MYYMKDGMFGRNLVDHPNVFRGRDLDGHQCPVYSAS